MVSSKLKNYFPQMGIMRTFREHQPLVVCCIIAIVLQIWLTLSVMLYYNNKQFKQRIIKNAKWNNTFKCNYNFNYIYIFSFSRCNMIDLLFIIGIILIVSIGLYLMKSTEDLIDYKNKEYLNPINKVKPKIKKWWLNLL